MRPHSVNKVNFFTRRLASRNSKEEFLFCNIILTFDFIFLLIFYKINFFTTKTRDIKKLIKNMYIAFAEMMC